LPLVVAAVLIASPAGIAAAQGESPFGEDVVTATTTVNLRIRSGPSVDAEILAVLPAGTIVGFTGFIDESGDWVQVEAAGGPTGWVWASWLSNVPEDLQVWSGEEAVAETPAEPAPAFGEGVVTATTTANLNIRSGPGVSFERLATLPFGTVVGFTGFTDATGEWVQVETADGIAGWVAAAYLSAVPDGLQLPPEDQPAEEETSEEEPAEVESPFGADVVTATTTVNLNLRSEPSLEAEILTVLQAGSLVGFTGFMDETGDWVQVDAADGPTGWVWASWLSNVPEDLNVWAGEGE
jgi:uncharacterized protein YraI